MKSKKYTMRNKKCSSKNLYSLGVNDMIGLYVYQICSAWKRGNVKRCILHGGCSLKIFRHHNLPKRIDHDQFRYIFHAGNRYNVPTMIRLHSQH
jgi:hypothetical protein